MYIWSKIIFMTENCYVHIPFCRSKCKYCSFVSFPKLEMKDLYLKALRKDIQTHYKSEELNTLYFGGGTPSILTVEEFSGILELFNLAAGCEVTTELNPETMSLEYLNKLKHAGINRISFGCQTFDDMILKNIGRRHSADCVKHAVKFAKNVGFENISLDFIYGLPEQSLKGFENDLNTAIELGVQHISLYGLKIDEGCYFYEHAPENLPDEDMQADMYLKAIEVLTNAGFEHYEISNFAKSGYQSRHNLNYWDNNSYYGFGVAAHGYEDGVRYFNTASIEEYLKNPMKHKSQHVLNEQEKLEEAIFLGFREMKGIDISKINSKFGIDFENKYKNIVRKYVNYGYLEQTDVGYKLSDSGILVSNVILAEFLE